LVIFSFKYGTLGGITYTDLHHVDGLHKGRLSSEHAGVETATGCGDDLTTSSVDGISVQGHIMNVKTNTTNVLVTEHTLKSTILYLTNFLNAMFHISAKNKLNFTNL